MNNKHFKEGEHIVYQNGDRFEIGKIKRIMKDGAFVYYSSGDTAAKTPFDCMHKLVNGYTIQLTSLGGGCWISVEDALPETDDPVLCWYEYYHCSKEKILPEYGIGYCINGRWGGEVSSGINAKVLAWMPLPLPPTEV